MAALPRVFPYEPRPYQADLVASLREALDEGAHVVVESGTGTGKTVCALSAALAAARPKERRVLYLTRTNAQARQVVIEYRAIRERSGVARTIVALQGRAHLCPLRRENAEFAKADSQELGVMCRDRMRAAEQARDGAKPKLSPCGFYGKLLEDGLDEALALVRAQAPDAEELAQAVEARGWCPYVVSRALLPEAEVVVAPYIWFFHPAMRAALLRWMGIAVEDLVVVVDEAHNLASYARDLASPALRVVAIERARQEVKQHGDPTLMGDTPLSRALAMMADVLEETAVAYLDADDDAVDALVPADEFETMLLSRLRVPTPALERALAVMQDYGEVVRNAKRKKGKVPRSYVGAVGDFLIAMRQLGPETHVAITSRDEGGRAQLELYALDAREATAVLMETGGSAHVSGTLAPLEEYRDTIGLPSPSLLAQYPSPFPLSNRAVVVDDGVSTAHADLAREPDMWARIGAKVQALRAATDRNMAVFVSSYEALDRLAPFVRAASTTLDVRRASARERMAGLARFKATRGGTLVSVVGGRLAEGLDFPDDQLEIVVVIGLPYGRPDAKTSALIRYYERRFGRGFAWAVTAPMTRRLQQATGRLLRSPDDRGVIVLLDRRAAMLRDIYPDLIVTGDVADATRRFFSR